MKKRFLGLICLLYSGIIIYVLVFDKLKNFLAPQMQIYIKLSLIPIVLLGFVMLFSNNITYKFKIGDLILILPLVFMILAGDGRLTASFASNRMTNIKKENKIEDKSAIEEESVIQIKEEDLIDNYDFSTIDFDITDASYNDLSSYLTYAPKATKFDGKTIRVRGFVLKKAFYLPEGYFAIGKYAISCCVADAGFTGFIVKYDSNKIINNNWYEIEGVLERDLENNCTLYIRPINIKEIDSKKEEQYVYPCYAYDDGYCKAISKYDLEY